MLRGNKGKGAPMRGRNQMRTNDSRGLKKGRGMARKEPRRRKQEMRELKIVWNEERKEDQREKETKMLGENQGDVGTMGNRHQG